MNEAPRTITAPSRWRAALVARPALQPLAFVTLAILYVWLVQPTGDDRLKIPFLAVVVVIPFLSNFLHRDGRRNIGLRLDNFGPSAREVGLVTAIGAIAVLAVGLLAGSGPVLHAGFLGSLILYPIWGLAQQYAMQSFTYRRLREATERPPIAAGLTALLFAALHYPNLPLLLLTLAGGYVWCRLFERHANLITLALSHGWLAVLLRATWPAEWLHNLRIGPSYWTWTP